VCSKKKKSDKNAEKKQKKDLTGPTLLEMTGPTLLEISEYATSQELCRDQIGCKCGTAGKAPGMPSGAA
jgi:hypothetical protein